MDALSNLKDHCPDWAKRLDELSGQIEQRQLDLAEFAAQQQQQQQQQPVRSSDGRTGSKKLVRNRGSTESLRPKDEGEAHSGSDTPGRTSPEHSSNNNNNKNKNAAHDARRASVASRGGIDKPQKGHPTNGNGNGNGNGNSSGSGNGSSPSAKARATMRRTQLSRQRAAAAAAESILSADGATPAKYRSRNLVIVYYDSYVQSFFEELVKFVSASRNLMRKAKMAARVAQIKRMAELEMPDDGSEPSGEDHLRWNGNGAAGVLPPQPAPMALKPDTPITEPPATNGEKMENGVGEKKELELPAIDDKPDQRNGNGDLAVPSPAGPPYIRPATVSNGNINGHKPLSPTPGPTPAPISVRPSVTAGFSSFSSSGLGFGSSQKPDVFDELDKGLEFVQSMCEHAAHQFLRVGDCADEIIKIKDRLNETKEKADTEMRRMLEQRDANGAPGAGAREEPIRIRTYRPQSMRKSALGMSPAVARTATTSRPGSGRFSIPKGGGDKPVAAAESGEIEGLLGLSNGSLEVDEFAGDK
ncbi:hypothetical protein VM1G_04175 [Cytospora mali]|uniref:Uncharacterized protein n=1 Tax=Cytospora mali TaxID=578113 RepID=A0A194VYG5_CYTMA|nr:hypothetical protein VM1G_04175 [Valsa mali]